MIDLQASRETTEKSIVALQSWLDSLGEWQIEGGESRPDDFKAAWWALVAANLEEWATSMCYPEMPNIDRLFEIVTEGKALSEQSVLRRWREVTRDAMMALRSWLGSLDKWDRETRLDEFDAAREVLLIEGLDPWVAGINNIDLVRSSLAD